MRLVIIESPFAAPKGTPVEIAPSIVARHLRFLRACARDCLARGEAPFASHAFYTQPGVLDDRSVAEREHGIKAGFAWREMAEATVVYTNLGVSTGMQYGIVHATVDMREPFRSAHVVEFRELPADWEIIAYEHEDSFVSQWPMFQYAEFPCGWDHPRADGARVEWNDQSHDPDDIEGLAVALSQAAREARRAR